MTTPKPKRGRRTKVLALALAIASLAGLFTLSGVSSIEGAASASHAAAAASRDKQLLSEVKTLLQNQDTATARENKIHTERTKELDDLLFDIRDSQKSGRKLLVDVAKLLKLHSDVLFQLQGDSTAIAKFAAGIESDLTDICKSLQLTCTFEVKTTK